MSGHHLNSSPELGIIGGVIVCYFVAGTVVEEITNVSRDLREYSAFPRNYTNSC